MEERGKKYRFFFHYFRQKDRMSVHFRDRCYVVDVVDCQVNCQSKKRTRQPRRVMQGWCEDIKILKTPKHGTVAVIK